MRAQFYLVLICLWYTVPSRLSHTLCSHAVDRATPFATPAGLHFLACLRRYGSPTICLNLVKKKERKKRESLLTEELLSSIQYLNQFLPPEHHCLDHQFRLLLFPVHVYDIAKFISCQPLDNIELATDNYEAEKKVTY